MQIGAAVGEMGLADGFDSRSSRHMCIEVPVSYLPCSGRFFSGISAFPLALETTQQNSVLESSSVRNGRRYNRSLKVLL